MNGPAPHVAIIIPCPRVGPMVARCVEACLAQDHPAFRVLVACPERPGTGRQDPRLTYVPTGAVRIGARRNRASEAAPEADYYAFIDSDAYPRRDWLRRGVAAFQRLPEDVWAVGGPNLPPPDEPRAARAVGYASQSCLVSGLRGYRKRTGPGRYSLDLPTCNLLVWGPGLRRLQGFREELVCGEDQDLCSRILQRGQRIYFDGETVVYHHDRPLLRSFLLHRLLCGNLGVLPVLRLHPHPRHLYMLLPLLVFLAVVGGLLLAAVDPSRAGLAGLPAGVFLTFCLVEAVRWAPPGDVPATALALAVGCLAPGLGTLLALLGVRLNLVSRNDELWRQPCGHGHASTRPQGPGPEPRSPGGPAMSG